MHVPRCRSWWQVCLSCRGKLTLWWSRLCLVKFCKCHQCRVSSLLLSTSYLVLQRLLSLLHVSDYQIIANWLTHEKGRHEYFQRNCVSQIRSRTDDLTFLLKEFYISSLAGSLISFQLTPSHIRGISLHFLTLSYGGGCFLGAFIIQLVYFLSGGEMNTNTVFHFFPLEHVIVKLERYHWI